MSRATSCKDAIKNWETKTGEVAAEATAVKLYAQNPPISKMDEALNGLDKCEHLGLSTNSIDRLIPLTGKVLVLSWAPSCGGQKCAAEPFGSSPFTGLVAQAMGQCLDPPNAGSVSTVCLLNSNIQWSNGLFLYFVPSSFLFQD